MDAILSQIFKKNYQIIFKFNIGRKFNAFFILDIYMEERFLEYNWIIFLFMI